MANITYRRTGELLRKLFEILIPQQDGLKAGVAIEFLSNQVKLTEYETGEYESGGRRLDKIVRFATLDCSKAGWLIKHKGKWTITDEGKQAYQKYKDPENFYRQAVQLYRQWRLSQPPKSSDVIETKAEDSVESKIEEESKEVSITFDQAEEQSWQEIEQFLKGMPPYEFQELVASLLRAMSYHISWISPPGKDGGIDILAYSDPLGTRPPRIKVQVKRYDSSITVDGLRSFMALLSDDDVGLFVTTSSFTRDAKDEARKQEKRKITLIDLERFFDLWIEYYSQLDDSARRRFPLRPIYFLAPEGK